MLDKIKSVFRLHGACSIETPVFEKIELLTGKYGDDEKLIYELKDQGGELLALRYDLTVPFARFLAMNRTIKSIKRYQIGKVYRRDQPIMTKGRLREFVQCDFDIAGEYDPMIPDAECFKVMSDILTSLDIGRFQIKFNDRRILDAIFELAGVEEALFRTVCSSVDKLDKMSWDLVCKEMITKGISEEAATFIGKYVSQPLGENTEETIKILESDAKFISNRQAKEGLAALSQLQIYLKAMGISETCKLDLSLARGLDYYTGVIMEAVHLEGTELGSLGGGGRYDNLSGMFTKKNTKIPCVGVSLGVERLFAILSAKKTNGRSNATQVFIASVSEDLTTERMKLATMLWNAGIAAEFMHKKQPKVLQQFSAAEKKFVDIVVVIGPEEIAKNVVKVRSMADRNELEVPVCDLIDLLRKRLGI